MSNIFRDFRLKTFCSKNFFLRILYIWYMISNCNFTLITIMKSDLKSDWYFLNHSTLSLSTSNFRYWNILYNTDDTWIRCRIWRWIRVSNQFVNLIDIFRAIKEILKTRRNLCLPNTCWFDVSQPLFGLLSISQSHS